MKTHRLLFLLFAIAFFVIPGCEFLGNPSTGAVQDDEIKPTEPVKPSVTPTVLAVANTEQATGFTSLDCSINGLEFPNITTGNNTFDPYDGPSLICNLTTTGEHGLTETRHLNINAIKPAFITSSYEEQKSVYKPIVDDAVAWKEKNPTASTEVIMLQEDEDAYIYLILTNANVQGCILGEGYGVEIIENFLVNYNFSSCEGDSYSYVKSIEALQQTARSAIDRLNKSQQP